MESIDGLTLFNVEKLIRTIVLVAGAIKIILSYLCQCTLSVPPENKKSSGFLMFSRGREKVYWEQMG